MRALVCLVSGHGLTILTPFWGCPSSLHDSGSLPPPVPNFPFVREAEERGNLTAEDWGPSRHHHSRNKSYLGSRTPCMERGGGSGLAEACIPSTQPPPAPPAGLPACPGTTPLQPLHRARGQLLHHDEWPTLCPASTACLREDTGASVQPAWGDFHHFCSRAPGRTARRLETQVHPW